MELQDRSRSPSRRTSRVEQVVGRWLRRSRDLGSRSHSLGRDRVSADGRPAESSSCDQRNYPFRFNVQIQRDPNLNSHGLTLSSQTPIVVQEVTPGGPADGRLAPGDQLVKINNVAVDDLTPEQAAEIIRECQETLSMTVLRIMLGPKSSFITPEKRAKLRSNPVKVHFAEEVEVNGHSQGNSLLFLPNVLKVYLENGQTKAFKFEPNTTVKDIVMTLKEKLSLGRIEHFSLVLEQQHSSNRLLLLHDEERIQQVVQKKEVHDYRCLFRVCFMPKDLRKMLQEDATAFEYLYLQGVNDVLQERYAVEMRCNTALRLAALHIQERLVSCGQSPKANLKMITKTWGIENFVSSTLLRNMREKDLRKAIGYHMKKCQSQHDAKQKGLSVDQARINYLEELSELKFFGGKSFGATLMLQDRESMVTLLVGARYGVSQVVNHKLSIMSTLTEFTSITRIELLPESDKVSLVKIYLQDIKPITLLLEAAAAKDMSCLIAGYCRVFIDSDLNVFPWIDDKKHRVSAEEGYVSRRASDSDNSSDLDMEPLLDLAPRDEKPRPRVRSSSDPDGRKKKERRRMRSTDGREKGGKPWGDKKLKGDTEKEMSALVKNQEGENEDTAHMEETDRNQDRGQIQPDTDSEAGQKQRSGGGEELRAAEEQPSVSEASDSYQTDSRVFTSPSSDSLDALEEDDFISCSSHQLHLHLDRHAQPHLLAPPPAHSHPLIHLSPVGKGGGGCRRSGDGADPHFLTTPSTQKCLSNHSSEDSSMCFAELSCLDDLPSPPEASEEDDDEEDELNRRVKLQEEIRVTLRKASDEISGGTEMKLHSLSPSPSSLSSQMDTVFNFDQRDARCYYNLCSNITPDSARSLVHPKETWEEEGDEEKAEHMEPIPILQPPPGFGDSSSDEEFFDAKDRLTSPEDPTSGTVPRDFCTEMKLDILGTLSLSDIRVAVMDAEKDGEAGKDRKHGDTEEGGRETLFHLRKRSRKRRSFMETDYTSRVSYPGSDQESKHNLASSRLLKNLLAEASNALLLSSEPEPSGQTQNVSPTISSFTHSEGEPAELESKPILSNRHSHGPGSLAAFEHNRGLKAHSRTRKQEMEMEPDAMESKSVTDLARASSPTITVVRCRVDPDGKESADRRCDGKEEGEEQEEMGNGKEPKKEESNGVTGSGPFTSHMFLPDLIKEQKEEEETTGRMERSASSLKRPLVGVQRPQEDHTPRGNKNDAPEFSGSSLTAMQINTHVDESFPLAYSPPPPPPSTPLPQIPAVHISGAGCLVREGGNSENMETSNKMTVINDEEQSAALDPETADGTDGAPSPVADEAAAVLDYTLTISDEVTDSTNSDNVFDDDDDDDDDGDGDGDIVNHVGHGPACKSNASSITARCKISDDSATAATDETQTAVKPLPLPGDQTGIPSVKVDHTAINSITAKLGAVTAATSPTFNSGICVKGEATLPKATCAATNADKPKADSTIPGAGPKETLARPSLMVAKTTSIYDVSKETSPPAHFLFQTCSPSFMGRLSASTLREKIQNLPLYLSRSQDSLNRIGDGSSAQSPAEENPGDDTDVSIVVTDVHDVTQTLVLETETVGESAESDDSDATVTGSELDGELFLETTPAGSVPSGSELKEAGCRMPVRTEPKPQHPSQCHYSGPIQNTPGPVTEPPASIVGLLQRDMNGLEMDTPGPLQDSPKPNIKVSTSEEDVPGYKAGSQSCSIPSAIVVTTQNLNGPGLAFRGQSHRVRRTSSVRPLIGLCRPSEETSDSSKAPSAGCKVFTICEDPSQTKTPAEVESAPPFKSEFACGSVLAAGCESVAESVQVPLDACSCPAVYTNCFRAEDSFDDELTVYEFSCRAQGSGGTQASGLGLPVMTSPPVTSFLSASSVHSPSFPHSILYSSSTSELSPLLSPLSDTSDSYVSQTHKDTISHLGQRRYPEPPAGFQVLRKDVDKLLSILESSGPDRSVKVHGGRHLRDTCPVHFTENKRVLQIEARKLMSCCQKVVGTGQSPEEMLQFLADSFRTLVELAGVCLWFSGCDRCDRRNAEAVAGLADVARSFRDFCLAAERASSKRSCQDLSTKLLAKQCTALTASVFCLTQLFRTLTAL
ncbi:uncharacterized protein frmpd1a [Xenentodon cancila]